MSWAWNLVHRSLFLKIEVVKKRMKSVNNPISCILDLSAENLHEHLNLFLLLFVLIGYCIRLFLLLQNTRCILLKIAKRYQRISRVQDSLRVFFWKIHNTSIGILENDVFCFYKALYLQTHYTYILNIINNTKIS